MRRDGRLFFVFTLGALLLASFPPRPAGRVASAQWRKSEELVIARVTAGSRKEI